MNRENLSTPSTERNLLRLSPIANMLTTMFCRIRAISLTLFTTVLQCAGASSQQKRSTAAPKKGDTSE
jgi:hypothetical protein